MSPVAFEDWPETPLSGEERRAISRRGKAFATQLLHEHGVMPPVSEEYADAYHPPLTLAEQRHRIHVIQEQPVEECRFCRPEDVSFPV